MGFFQKCFLWNILQLIMKKKINYSVDAFIRHWLNHSHLYIFHVLDKGCTHNMQYLTCTLYAVHQPSVHTIKAAGLFWNLQCINIFLHFFSCFFHFSVFFTILFTLCISYLFFYIKSLLCFKQSCSVPNFTYQVFSKLLHTKSLTEQTITYFLFY